MLGEGLGGEGGLTLSTPSKMRGRLTWNLTQILTGGSTCPNPPVVTLAKSIAASLLSISAPSRIS